MSERIATFLVWTLVGCSAGALALRLWPQGSAPAVPLAASERLAAPSLDRLLGPSSPPPEAAQAPAAPADARFQLLGLVAARQPERQDREGLALLAVDGGTPRSVRVGQVVEGDLQLLRVEPTGVSLGRQGAVQVQLRLDPPPPAAQGSLPSLSLAPVPGAPQGLPMAPMAQPTPGAPPAAFGAQAPQPAANPAPTAFGAPPQAAPPISGPMPAPVDGLPRRRNPVETLR
ncbi:hypothetical protein [Inhella sp.]|uniref:hypothetical protein n=1 Tax=Inhella sp. TaxID=1921806 RepID=UPI0035AFFF2A